jgi:hypothetical protein
LISFQLEKWAGFYPDAKPLFDRHWRELALNQAEIPIDCDVERYQQMEDLGILLVLTARSGERLAGYLLSFLMPHLHYKSSGKMAITDMYFMLPEFRRGTGAQLFLEWERVLRSRSIKLAMTSCKVHQDHSRLFTRLGWTHSDNTFVKLLSPVNSGAQVCP